MIAFGGIVRNSVEATSYGGTVSMNLSLQSVNTTPNIQLIVQDQGVGMDEKALSSFFPFFTPRQK